nr:nucleotide pyrophosphatase [Calditrichia bacterium]
MLKIDIQGYELILRQGEWSDWIPLTFEFLPMFSGVNGMIRIYAQEVHPNFRLYMSPINIDPMEAHVPISSPRTYSKELSEAIGRFYTQGFPEDTKALSHGVFSNEEFLAESKYVLDERLRAFDHEFSQFDDGLFFFYFSSVDQNTHVMWRDMDPTHPLYEPNASKEAKEAVYYFYRAMDDVLRRTLEKLDSRSTLMLLSDHGFAPFGREFHLSTWLVENGFTSLTDPENIHKSEFYDYVDWSK